MQVDKHREKEKKLIEESAKIQNSEFQKVNN